MSIALARRAFTFLGLAAGLLLATMSWGNAAGAGTPQPDLVKLLPPRIASTKTLTVAVALGSPPDDFRNAEGQIAGWEIDILQAAAETLGLKLDLRPTTFDSLFQGCRRDASTPPLVRWVSRRFAKKSWT